MKNQLVSIETAKLAKEKGFGVFEEYWYNNDQLLFIQYPGDEGLKDYLKYTEDEEDNTFPIDNYIYLAPTQSLLTKWLREKHNIIVSIIPHFYAHFEGKVTVKYQYVIGVYKDVREFDKWEDCLEIGLQEALSQIN